MLEDDKTQELKRKRDLDGYDSLDCNELKYLLTHTVMPYEQETIEKLLIVRKHEELVKETKKLVQCTWWLTIATWFVALMTLLAPFSIKFIQYLWTKD